MYQKPFNKRSDVDAETRAWLDRFAEYPRLTDAEERELGHRAHAGDRAAAEKLVFHNMRLVVHVAQHYAMYGGMPMMDLVQEGTIGLMKAVEKYRPDEHPDNRFGSFAGWLVRQTCGRALSERANVIRIPTYLWTLRAQVWAVESRYAYELTDAEIATLLDSTPARVHAARTAYDIPLSLTDGYTWQQGGDTRRGHDDSTPRELIETLPADDNVEEDVLDAVRNDALYAALAELTPRERTVIRLRYGLGAMCDEHEMTVKAVAKRLHLAVEAVRLLERSALAKLRDALGAHYGDDDGYEDEELKDHKIQNTTSYNAIA